MQEWESTGIKTDRASAAAFFRRKTRPPPLFVGGAFGVFLVIPLFSSGPVLLLVALCVAGFFVHRSAPGAPV